MADASVACAHRRTAARHGAAALIALVFAGTAGGEEAPVFVEPAFVEPVFVEVAAEVGLDFVHFNGMSGRYYFSEVVGAGGALFDYDNDGDLDLYLVQGHMLGSDDVAQAVLAPRGPLRDRLYRNDLTILPDGRRQLRFTEVTEESGVDARGYGMGTAVGDFDGDGWLDLYVANFGANQLWRNRGRGADGKVTFSDVTEQAGASERRWSVAASFLDFDRDGHLDLYIGNYVDYQLAKNRACIGETGLRDYCGPQTYPAESDRLLRGRGDGTFEDVSERVGITAQAGATLGMVSADFDGDGWIDIYIANDQMPNQLWLSQRDAAGVVSFSDDALLLGGAVNRDGEPEASMGVDAGDFDQDGDEDLFMTHLTRESNTLYVNDGGIFRDRSRESGLAHPSWRFTGFGAAWLDYDNDSLLDLLVANGAVFVIFELMAEDEPYPLHQTNQLFRGLGGGRFAEATATAGAALALSEVSRGAIFGDIDNDGDTDVVVTNNSGPVRLLLNQVGQNAAWLGLRLVDGDGRRDQLGARVAVYRSGQPTLWRRAHSDGSYASASDPRVLVGLGNSTEIARVEVTWPDGRVEAWKNLAIGRYHTLRQGSGTPAQAASGS